jgi:hypothetical protein
MVKNALEKMPVPAVMVNRWFTKRRQTGYRVLISLLSAFFSAYSTNIKRFA